MATQQLLLEPLSEFRCDRIGDLFDNLLQALVVSEAVRLECNLEVFFFDAKLQVNLVEEECFLILILCLQVILISLLKCTQSLVLQLRLEVKYFDALISAELTWNYLSKSLWVALRFAFP